MQETKTTNFLAKSLFVFVIVILCYIACIYVNKNTTDPIGCAQGEYLEVGQFELVDYCRENPTTAYEILADRNTGVLYLRYSYGNRCGITALYNSDGTIMTLN